MLRMLKTEMMKLRRRQFFLLATLAAVIFPVPVSLLAAKTGQGYDFLFKLVINIGHFVLLVPVLCIVAAMLFFEERDNNTLKSLLAIPVSLPMLAVAKLTVLLIISIAYSVFAYTATLVGGVLGKMQIDHMQGKLMVCIIMGVMTWVVSLPGVALLIGIKKNYVFSLLASFIYAITGFIVTGATLPQAVPNIFLIIPINVINRWLLPYFQNLATADYPFDIMPCIVGTPACVLYLLIYTVVFTYLICVGFKRWER